MSSLQDMPIGGVDRSEHPAWMGDPGFVAEDYIYNYDMANFWAKWLNDIKDSQKSNGDLPFVVPLHWRQISGHGDAPYGVYVAWDSAYPLIVWYVYQYYDDQRVLQEHYDGLKRLVGFIGANAKNHIVSRCFGDHMEPQPDGTSSESPIHTSKALTSTAYYYFDAWIIAQAAKVLGKTEDAKRYTNLAETIKAAFNRKFFNQKTNQYSTASQTSNAMPLYFRMVPEGRENAVLKNLTDDILINHKGHLSTGIIGTNALAQVLGLHGKADVMYKIATQTTFPSWGEQILHGATTLWESWEAHTEPQLSLNMYMFGSVDKFFYRDRAGICSDAPGFKRIVIKPQPVGDLTYASGSVKTVRGIVSSSWKRTDDSVTLDVTTPVNSLANISVPKTGLRNVTITESGKTIWKNGEFLKGIPGITSGTEIKDDVTFETGSGSYTFVLTGQK